MNVSFEPESIVEKGWGREVIIEDSTYCAKFLNYNKRGSVSSAHLHRNKSECFVVISKSFEFHYWDNEGEERIRILKQGDFVNIPATVPHQLRALEDNASIFEASDSNNIFDTIRIRPGDSQNNVMAQMARDNK